MATSPRTLHRLLGSRPGSRGRFHYNHLNRLPHDVVIIDETSMVSLTLMARLLEALGDDARLILIGDPDQLSSIEAGAVLGDIAAAVADSVIILDRVHRFGVGIAAVADAVRRGDAEGTVTALRASGGDVTWIAEDSDAIRADAALAPVRERGDRRRTSRHRRCSRRRRARRAHGARRVSDAVRPPPRTARRVDLDAHR